MTIDEELVQDLVLYGNSFEVTIYRSWWNPMRYILGEVKRYRVPPENIHITKRET